MNKTLARKVAYCLAIALLIYPLYLIGAAATGGSGGVPASAGMLAKLRTEHSLSTADLGEVDPASEAMKLASLGMRGVGSVLLWKKAEEFKKRQDFENLSVACEQIIRLQPNFMSVWEFQAHNLAYNVSAEFDDYRHRYHWVVKGIDFLIKGNDYNRNEPRLLYYVGWFTAQKLGRSDEHVQYRRMFREDVEFHDRMALHVEGMNLPVVNGPGGFPDNWLAARLWYGKARSVVDDLGRTIRGTSPLVFHSQPAMSRMNYSDAIEDEGVFGEAARTGWQQAGEEWREFGLRPLPSSWENPVVLGEGENIRRQLRESREELKNLSPNHEQLLAEHAQKLSDIERRAWETTESDRSQWGNTEWRRFEQAMFKMAISDRELANAAPPESRAIAVKLAKRIEYLLAEEDHTDRYRSIVNYVYWRERARVEQTQLASEARELLYQADDARRKTELDKARKKYEEAWDRWAKIFADFPGVQVDISARELETSLRGYEWTLLQLGETGLPEDFKLKWILNPEGVPSTMPNYDASDIQIRLAEEEKEKERLRLEQERQVAPDRPPTPKTGG